MYIILLSFVTEVQVDMLSNYMCILVYAKSLINIYVLAVDRTRTRFEEERPFNIFNIYFLN